MVDSGTLLQSFLANNELPNGLSLQRTTKGIELLQLTATAKPLLYTIDIDKFAAKQKTFPAPAQGAFNQALGRKTKTIIDATAGWGSDSLLMCSQGYLVTLIERQPLMLLLLQDAMQQLALTDWAQHHCVVIPKVVSCDAIAYLQTEAIDVDCVYLDPMFPSKRKKSAATNKYMQLLQELVGADQDADYLLEAARQSGAKRVVVKRPDYAEPLGQKPDEQFISKLVHYDVYLRDLSITRRANKNDSNPTTFR